jgi:hypothetical protein
MPIHLIYLSTCCTPLLPGLCGGLPIPEALGVTERSLVGSYDPKKPSLVPHKTRQRQNRCHVDEKSPLVLLLSIEIHAAPVKRNPEILNVAPYPWNNPGFINDEKILPYNKQGTFPKKSVTVSYDLAPDQADIEIAPEDTTWYLRLCRAILCQPMIGYRFICGSRKMGRTDNLTSPAGQGSSLAWIISGLLWLHIRGSIEPEPEAD